MKPTLNGLIHCILCILASSLIFNSCSYPLRNDVIKNQEERDSILAQAAALRQEGRKWRDKADYAQALTLEQKALELSMKIEDTLGMIQDYNQIGTTFRRMGRLEEAFRLHYEALFYAEMHQQDTSFQSQKNLVVSLNGLGNTHLSLGNSAEALICFRRALQGEIAIKSNLGQAINYANIGGIMEKDGQLDSARYYYDLSMQKNVELNNLLGISLCHTYFGHIFEQQGDYLTAEQEYREAADLMKESEDRWHAAEPLVALGSLYLKLKRPDAAQPIIAELSSIATQIKAFELLFNAEQMQCTYSELIGDYKKAYMHHQQACAYHDSINSSASQSSIREICINYERKKGEYEKENMRQAYEREEELHHIIEHLGAFLLFICIIGFIIMIYVYRLRSKSLDALRSVQDMRTTFFTNVTNELRNPITDILSATDRLDADINTEEERSSLLASIRQKGRAQLELVDQLLGISKLMAGFGQEEWRHGNVLDFVKIVMSRYECDAQKLEIQLNVKCEDGDMDIDFVPKHIERIIGNLLSNSFKFTPKGGSVTLTLSRQGKYLNMEMSDTGCGIPNKDLPHVFELFYQGEASRKKGSAGIGLPFVKQMVQCMGGIICIENIVSRGTLISITLPVTSNDDKEVMPWEKEDMTC